MSALNRKILVVVGYIFLCMIAWWRIAFAVNPILYDMAEAYMPWRYFIGESLQAGWLPIWNPYSYMGYPVGYDPQGAAWYPTVWLIGYFGGFNFTTLSYEFCFHLLLGALGAYKLGRLFSISPIASWFMGAAWCIFRKCAAYEFCRFYCMDALGCLGNYILFYFLDLDQSIIYRILPRHDVIRGLSCLCYNAFIFLFSLLLVHFKKNLQQFPFIPKAICYYYIFFHRNSFCSTCRGLFIGSND
jgi:hypothetical protein